MIRIWIYLVLIFIVGNLSGQKTSYIFVDVYFKTDKFDLSKAEQDKIKAVLDTLDKSRIKMVQMAGHTDSRADSLYNVELSKKRASAVALFCLEYGIPKEKIKPGFFGENRPKGDNVSEKGLQRNRRVEMRITYLEAGPVMEMAVEKVDTPFCATKPCNALDTVLYLDNGMALRMNLCNAEIWDKCIKKNTIGNARQALESGMLMRDEAGIPLESNGMFSMEWKPGCDSCKNFEADLLMTREEYEKQGFGFYTYDDANKNWDKVPKKKVQKITRNGEVFYKITLNCDDIKAGRRFNFDRCLANAKVFTKIKLKSDWDLDYYAADSIKTYFFVLNYDTTENIERNKVWKVPPASGAVVGLRNKKTGEVVEVALHLLKPAKFKLLMHRLVKSHGGRSYNTESGWPHLKTAKVKDDKGQYFYKKYKVTKRVLLRATA